MYVFLRNHKYPFTKYKFCEKNKTVDLLYICDLIGTFAFAVYGAYIGFRKEFDIFGVSVCAFLCALGGGTIREILLNNPPVYFHNYTYLYVVCFGIAFCTYTYKHFHRINRFMLILDAIGLATFAFIGATRGANAHIGPVGIIMFAPLTAVGGGILKDVVVHEIPSSFKGEIYATPTILLGIIYLIFQYDMRNPLYAFLLIVLTFSIRVFAIQYHIHARNWKEVHQLCSKTPYKSIWKPSRVRMLFFHVSEKKRSRE